MKKLITYLPYLSFGLFFLNRFVVAEFAKAEYLSPEHWLNTLFWANQSICFVLLFIYIRSKISGRKTLLNAVLGFFVAEIITHIFYGGITSPIEVIIYVICIAVPIFRDIDEKKKKNGRLYRP